LAVRRLHVRTLNRPAGRLAVADALLAALTMGMLMPGLWDWLAGHPTRIRWHAIIGVVLAGFLLVHALRGTARLRFAGPLGLDVCTGAAHTVRCCWRWS